MNACPGTACPHWIGQGCRCEPHTEPDPYAGGEPIDMRSRERRWELHRINYVEPVDLEAS